MLKLKATAQIEQPPLIAAKDWLEQNVVMPEGTETAGMPFSVADFPHCAGICDAFDRPDVRRIVLQWGTRLGKTTTALSLMAKVAGTKPRNMMISSTSKDSVGRIVSSRLYPILRKCGVVSENLPALGHQGKFHVDLKTCRVYVGWSGSASSLADVGAWFAIANEIDKWDADKSTEADPLDLFINRTKGFVDHKIILESTPTIKGRSRVERALRSSKRHDRWVPCPHCGEYQILIKGDADSPGGIKWERDENGKSDADTAFATAYYQCAHCLGRIEDYHRVPMLRRGVWCPEGCTVDRSGAVVGRAYREGSDIWGFGPLPSWYSCIERWGNFARQWVAAQGNKRQLQDVFNSYMAETWEETKKKSTWEELYGRITSEAKPRVVPLDCSMLTVGIDKQLEHYVYVVEAWAPDRVGAVIDYGTAQTLTEIEKKVVFAEYQHADGGSSVAVSCALIDSGYNPTEADGHNVYEFASRCRRNGRQVFPCKGSNTRLETPYRVTITGENTAMPGQKLVHVDTFHSQTWLESRLHTLRRGDPGCLSLFGATGELHQDFLEQLLNDAADVTNDKVTWNRIHDSVPNDYRDCVRYADTAMLLATRRGPIHTRVASIQPRLEAVAAGESRIREMRFRR